MNAPPLRLRERYACRGPTGLSDAQLLAMVLGTGSRGRSAESICASLLVRFGGLRGVRDAPPPALAQEVGVGPVRAARLHAALQLSARLGPTTVDLPVIATPHDLVQLLSPILRAEVVETFWSVALDRRSRPVCVRQIARGTRDAVVVDPSEVYRPAIQLRASAVVVAHNHPSGCARPSESDRQVTRRLAKAGVILGIPLMDHLILAGDEWTSLAELGELPSPVRR